MAVDLSEMRKLFAKGALRAAIVAPAPMESDAWVLMVIRTDGPTERTELMTIARSDQHKIYRSLEAVHADAKRVGFEELRLKVA